MQLVELHSPAHCTKPEGSAVSRVGVVDVVPDEVVVVEPLVDDVVVVEVDVLVVVVDVELRERQYFNASAVPCCSTAAWSGVDAESAPPQAASIRVVKTRKP